MLQRVSIGFDLRDPTQQRIGGTEQRDYQLRGNQVLSNSLDLVISADPNVLPRREDIDQLIFENIEVLSNPLGFVTRIDDLIDKCRASGLPLKGQLPLCITCSEANIVELVERFGPGWFELQLTEKEITRADWQLRGFDVIDLRGLVSGLSGCGYNVSTKHLLKHFFEAGLNKFGLFRSYSLGQQFAEVRGLQIPEHVPLITVGVLANPRLGQRGKHGRAG
jgi:hypothetical protein